MNKIDHTIVAEAKIYVSHLLDHKLSKDCLFHTKKHTLEVLKNTETIAEYSKLDENALNILRVAALFHDVGYINTYENHEEESAAYAAEFLELKNIYPENINQVTNCIMATKMPQSPKDELSKILCDADLMNMTFDDYMEQIDLMRQEWDKIGKASLNEHEFHLNSLRFFKAHKYHSEYGKKILQPKKEQTELKIKEQVNNNRK